MKLLPLSLLLAISIIIGFSRPSVAVGTADGHIGVGTKTPLSMLDIAGGTAIGTYAATATAPDNGLIVSGDLGIGTASPKSSVDFSGKTDGLLLQTASAAANAACSSTLNGAIRFNSHLSMVEFCDGAAWGRMVLSACDNTSANLNLGDLTNLTTSTLTTSSIALVTGMDSGCTVSVGISGTGGNPEYRVCSDAACSSVTQDWTNANNTLDVQGKYIQARATTSGSASTSYTVTVAVGSTNSTWTISTGMSGCAPEGTVCSDGTVYAGLSGTSVPMYVTRCDAGQSWSGSACTGTRSTFSWNSGNSTGYTTTSLTSATTGAYNTAALIVLDSDSVSAGTQQHLAAQYCADLTEGGHSDWYLPAKNELATLYTNNAAIGNFDTSGANYWASTDNTNYGVASYQKFSDGTQSGNYKSLLYFVRCVRGTTWQDVSASGPAAFNFTDQTDVDIGVTVQSNAVTLSGLTGSMTATCGTGCTGIARNGTWGGTSVAGFVSGDTIQIALTSSSSSASATTATVSVGTTTSGTWTVTTKTDSCATAAIGDVCPDGTVYAGLSGASTRMYATRCDMGQSWSGSCTGTRGTTYWNNGNNTGYTTTGITSPANGLANTASLATADSDSGIAGTQAHLAAVYCDSLTQDGHSDWYLPAKNELATLYTNETAIGNFDTSGTCYWSSTENANSSAYYQRFSDGSQNSGTKSYSYLVRCIRR